MLEALVPIIVEYRWLIGVCILGVLVLLATRRRRPKKKGGHYSRVPPGTPTRDRMVSGTGPPPGTPATTRKRDRVPTGTELGMQLARDQGDGADYEDCE